MPAPTFATGVLTTAQLNALSAYIDQVEGRIPAIAYKTADETVNNSATLQSDNELLLPMSLTSTKYRLRSRCLFLSNTTPDLKIGWSGPSGFTMNWSIIGFQSGTFAAYAYDASGTPNIDGAGVNDEFFIDGTVTTSSTAGTLTLTWAQNTANASDTIMRAGSYIELAKIG